jgi:hypothetical protein
MPDAEMNFSAFAFQIQKVYKSENKSERSHV